MERVAYTDNMRNTANVVRLFIHAGVPYMVTVTGMLRWSNTFIPLDSI